MSQFRGVGPDYTRFVFNIQVSWFYENGKWNKRITKSEIVSLLVYFDGFKFFTFVVKGSPLSNSVLRNVLLAEILILARKAPPPP